MKSRRGLAAVFALAGITVAAIGMASSTIASAAPPDGKRLYIRCQACHSTAAGQPDKVGPNLHGFYGKKAAAKPGFRYSSALSKSNVRWDDKTLDVWLTRPSKLVPGTTMAFPGMTNPAERAALIAYLKTVTK
jgi:cytochrome c